MISPSTIDPLQLPSVGLTDRKQLPQIPCIYFAIDIYDQIQYIGRSVNPRQRWQTHHRQAQLIGCRIAYLQVDGCDLERIENDFILKFQPRINFVPAGKGAASFGQDEIVCAQDFLTWLRAFCASSGRRIPQKFSVRSVSRALGLTESYYRSILAGETQDRLPKPLFDSLVEWFKGVPDREQTLIDRDK
jgi:hypothetical protein